MESVQWTVTNMMKWLAHLSCEKRLGHLGLLSLMKRSLGGHLIHVHKYLKVVCKQEGTTLFGGALYQDKRQCAQTGTLEIPFECQEMDISCEGDEAPRCQKGYRVSSLEIFKNKMDMVLDSLLQQEIWLGDLQKLLPTSTNLRFSKVCSFTYDFDETACTYQYSFLKQLLYCILYNLNAEFTIHY